MNTTILPELRSLFPEEIAQILKEYEIPRYRADQIFSWIYKGVESFDEMTNLPLSLREKCKEIFCLDNMQEAESISSKLDETVKYLFTLHDGEYVESVLLSYKHGYSVCLSTQAGCKMGCKFCASTKAGFSRNLLPGEILSQMLWITKDQKKKNPDFAIRHIVLMGIGEPLDNFENVVHFLKLVNHPQGFGIGARNISLSTCGLIPQIRKLAELNLQITLSVSLHASNSRARDALMPVNRTYPLPELIEACREYTKKTGRRISFEFGVIAGVNDSAETAKELACLLRGMGAHVNLIPINHTKETDFFPASRKALQNFVFILEQNGINATIRRTLGADIDAACGQLRREKKAKPMPDGKKE